MESKGYAQRWLGLTFICVSLLVISLDNTILNVALPSISRDLGASQSDLQWIVDAYILVFAALLLTMGSIGDRFGRKRSLQVGVALFGVFSAMAAFSTSTEMLVVARALLGIGGAIIMPATLSLITAMFRDEKERAQAIAIWAAIFGLGVGIGPLLGGYLIEAFDWGAVFFVNIPVVIVALIGGQLFLVELRDENAPPPDVPGAVLSFAGLFTLVYAIIEAGVDGWEATNVLVAFAAAAVLLVAFFWWEARSENAMLPLYLFRNPSFSGANIAMTLMMFGMFGSMFFLTQYFQSVQGYSAIETGWRMLPMSIAIMVAAALSARVTERLGTKITVGVGFLLAAGGMVFMSQTFEPDTAYGTVLFGLSIMAAGMGLAMSPATNSIMGSVPVSKAGVGSAMNDTTRMVGGALGVAVLGTVMNETYLSDVGVLEGQLSDPAMFDGVSGSIQAAHHIAGQLAAQVPELGERILSVANSAFVNGMTDAMVIAGFMMVAASLFTFVVLPSEIRCMEDDCAEDDVAVGAEGEPVPAMGD